MVEGKPIHVLMVDDHELMRQAYGTLLGEDPGIEIVGLAGDGQQGVPMAAKLAGAGNSPESAFLAELTQRER
jgi:DNA-binding NarL/FixJ family response regulator